MSNRNRDFGLYTNQFKYDRRYTNGINSISAKEKALRETFDTDLVLLEELYKDEMYDQSTRRLYKFFVNFWNTFDPSPLVDNWHIECLCEHAQAAVERKIRRLIVNISPRSSKSTVNSICLPAWHWLKNPHEKFWLFSHSAKLFVQNIVYARRILDHPLYKEKWCNLEGDPESFKYSLTKDVNTKTRIENSAGGYILGGSPTSGALGMGYTTAVLDDLLDSEEANNPIAIDNANQWFTQTFMNRSNDVNTDVVIIVMQRLAQNDLTDYVQKTYGDQDWFVLNLPAKYDPARTFFSPIGFNDKRQVRNELLDPIRLPDSFLAQQAKNPKIYNTRYLQNPDASSEGNLLQATWIRESDRKPHKWSSMYTIWDLAFTDSPTSTYTVGLVICRFQNEFHMVDMFRKQCDIPSQLDAIRNLKNKYPSSIIAVEKRANGHAAMSLLRREIKNIYAIEPRLFGGSKEQRFDSVLPYFRDRKVFIYNPFKPDTSLEDTYDPEEIKKELKAFPVGQYNDIVDCVAYGIQLLAEKGQEAEAMISNGEKMKISDEDFISSKRRETGFYSASFNLDDMWDSIPSRSDIQDIGW